MDKLRNEHDSYDDYPEKIADYKLFNSGYPLYRNSEITNIKASRNGSMVWSLRTH